MNDQATKHVMWYSKDYLIDYKTQFRILLRLGSVAILFASLLCFASYEWLSHLRPIFTQALTGPITPDEAFTRIADLLLIRLMIILGLMVLFFLTVGIYLTHRFTGPIWKLRRDLNTLLSGEKIGPLKFRQRDEFQELPALINKLIEGYRKS